MLPFRIHLRPGASISEQIVYAAKRAIVSGQLRPGDAFPSVRVLSREAHINPNTAAKIIAALVADELLEASPGVGTVVAPLPLEALRERPALREIADLLGRSAESLVVQAKHLGVPREDLLAAIDGHWQQLAQPQTGNPGPAVPSRIQTKGDTTP